MATKFINLAIILHGYSNNYVCSNTIWISAQSSIRKRISLISLIHINPICVLIGIETWPSNSVVNNEVIPAQMNYIYNITKRLNGDGYESVMIVVSKRIQSVPLLDLQTSCRLSYMGEVTFSEMQRSVSQSFLQATCLRSILIRTIKQLI